MMVDLCLLFLAYLRNHAIPEPAHTCSPPNTSHNGLPPLTASHRPDLQLSSVSCWKPAKPQVLQHVPPKPEPPASG